MHSSRLTMHSLRCVPENSIQIKFHLPGGVLPSQRADSISLTNLTIRKRGELPTRGSSEVLSNSATSGSTPAKISLRCVTNVARYQRVVVGAKGIEMTLKLQITDQLTC